MVREYHTANRDKINPLKLAYMVMNVELMSETDKAVVHLMKKVLLTYECFWGQTSQEIRLG